MIIDIVYFITGLIFLILGAETLVRGASSLAAVFGISPLVIGLTVVAFGTSSPELAVSVEAALSNQANLAVGNVVGSYIFNVLFILGLSALIMPLCVSKPLIRFDVPLMIALSVIMFVLSVDGHFSHMDGWILIIGLVMYVSFLIIQSRRDNAKLKDESIDEVETIIKTSWLKNVIMILMGLTLLAIGSRWLVNGAVIFAQYLGVSELIIGLTIVAAGTSLPELVTSVVAAIRGERDIAVGNVVGSNIFNIMGVLGCASLFSPSGIDVSPAVISIDIPIMIVVSLMCLPIFYTGGIISRKEGALFLVGYLAYTLYLVLTVTKHDSLSIFNNVMLFAIPLTLISLNGLAFMDMRKRKSDGI